MILPSTGCASASAPTPAAVAANAYIFRRRSKSERREDFLVGREGEGTLNLLINYSGISFFVQRSADHIPIPLFADSVKIFSSGAHNSPIIGISTARKLPVVGILRLLYGL